MGLYHQFQAAITFANLIHFIQILLYKIEMIMQNPSEERFDEDLKSTSKTRYYSMYMVCSENFRHLSNYTCMVLWCSAYHYCKTSFIETWTNALQNFKSWSWRVRDLQWSGSLTMLQAGNMVKHFLRVIHTTITQYHRSISPISINLSIHQNVSFKKYI